MDNQRNGRVLSKDEDEQDQSCLIEFNNHINVEAIRKALKKWSSKRVKVYPVSLWRLYETAVRRSLFAPLHKEYSKVELLIKRYNVSKQQFSQYEKEMKIF